MESTNSVKAHERGCCQGGEPGMEFGFVDGKGFLAESWVS